MGEGKALPTLFSIHYSLFTVGKADTGTLKTEESDDNRNTIIKADKARKFFNQQVL